MKRGINMENLGNVLAWMQRIDPNGNYDTIPYELESGEFTVAEVVFDLLEILRGWEAETEGLQLSGCRKCISMLEKLI